MTGSGFTATLEDQQLLAAQNHAAVVPGILEQRRHTPEAALTGDLFDLVVAEIRNQFECLPIAPQLQQQRGQSDPV
jgi:hypothetical protein